MSPARRALLFVMITVLIMPVLLAQTNAGSITGTITDPASALVPGAEVVAKNVATGVKTRTTSTSSGSFTLPQLAIGTYDVTVTSSSFQVAVRRNVTVEINTPAILNVQLQTQEASQTVTVNANAPSVQATTSDIATVVTPRQVEDLPLSLGGVGAFRSPEAFVFLTPGATGPGTAGSANGVYVDKIAGSQNFGNEVLLDGLSAVRPDNGSTFDETAPSVEAIQEFRVVSSTPEAMYGRTTGGLESFGTRSGGNALHGGAFDIIRNTAFDANTWFNNGFRAQCAAGDTACSSSFVTPKDIKNDFGVSLSGPVTIPHVYQGRDRTFFFFAWEQLRWPRGGTTTSTLPTVAERNGDFSQQLTTTVIGNDPCTGAPVFAGQIFDPATTYVAPNGQSCRTAFPGNVVPSARIGSVARAVLGYVPLPNLNGTVNNFSLKTNFPTTNTTYTIRIDENAGAKDRFFANYSTRENTLLTGGTPVLPNPIDPNTWNQDFSTHFGRAGWDHTFSGTLLNHFAAGYNRTNSKNNSGAVGLAPDWPGALGIGNVHGTVFPQFVVGESIPNFGQPRGDDDINNTALIADTVTWVRGPHTVNLGVDGRFYQYNNLAYDNTSGSYSFARGETANANNSVLTSQGGNSFASFLLGNVDSATALVYAHYPRYTTWYGSIFAQDDFRLTPRLTLNLGFRWSVDTPRTEAKGFTSNFDPTLPNAAAGGLPGALEFGTTCHCSGRWAHTYLKDFAPRVGFAYQPYKSGNTVFRGGYGILYGPLLYSDFGNSLNAGYAASPNPVSTDSSFSPAFNIQSGFPAFAPPPNLDPGLRNGQSIDYAAPEYGKPPMLQTWNLQVQQQIATDLIMSVAYVGNHGTRQRTAAGFGRINDIRLSSFALGSLLNDSITSPAAIAAGFTPPYPGFTGVVGNALRPFPQYLRVNADCCLENDGQSTFHALEVALQRRLRQGLTLQLSYTWSKSLTDADSMLPGTNGGGGLYQNPFDLHEEKALSSQDLRHTFVGSYVYELPIGRQKRFMNQSAVLDAFLGGWEVGGVQRYESGQPLPFYCAGSIPGFDNCVRFNPVPGQSVYNAAVTGGGFDPFTQPYINRGYFVDPNAGRGTGAYRLGTLPRVTGFRMPNYDQEDFSLQKRFRIHENLSFLLRGEAFNAFNRHVFSEPYDLGPNDPNFGLVNSTVDSPRQLQVTGRIQF
jgi:hypothetical protein